MNGLRVLSSWMFSLVALAGVAIAIAAPAWWYFNRGEIIDRVSVRDWVTAGPITVGFGDAEHPAGTQEAFQAKLGPYPLSPADNRLSFAARMTPNAKLIQDRISITLNARVEDTEGNHVWEDSYRLYTKRSSVEKQKKRTSSLRGGLVAYFSPISVPAPGQYFFFCQPDPTTRHRLERPGYRLGLTYTIRRNAQSFPVLWLLVGLGLAVLGSVAYKFFGPKENDPERPRTPHTDAPPTE